VHKTYRSRRPFQSVDKHGYVFLSSGRLFRSFSLWAILCEVRALHYCTDGVLLRFGFVRENGKVNDNRYSCRLESVLAHARASE